MEVLGHSLIASWFQVSCGKALHLSCDRHPESACGPKQRTSQSSRQAARGQSSEECNPSRSPPPSLSFSLFCVWWRWESMQGETFLWWPIIACPACGRWLFTKGGRGILFFSFALGVCRIADVADVVESRGRILLWGRGCSLTEGGGGAFTSSLFQCGGCCGANRCSKYLQKNFDWLDGFPCGRPVQRAERR